MKQQLRLHLDERDAVIERIDAVLLAMREMEKTLIETYGHGAEGDFGWHVSRWQTLIRRVERFRDELGNL